MNDNYFVDYGVKTAANSKAADAVVRAVPDLYGMPGVSFADFVKAGWTDSLAAHGGSPDNSTRGKIFEFVLLAAFLRAELTPFYFQANVSLVPNALFDFVVWTDTTGPIAISAKTSFRERWKRAVLEAMAIRNVYRRAETYLVTLDSIAAARLKSKIRYGDVTSLTDVVIADTQEFNDLIMHLKTTSRVEAPVMPAIESGNMVQGLGFGPS